MDVERWDPDAQGMHRVCKELGKECHYLLGVGLQQQGGSHHCLHIGEAIPWQGGSRAGTSALSDPTGQKEPELEGES